MQDHDSDEEPEVLTDHRDGQAYENEDEEPEVVTDRRDGLVPEDEEQATMEEDDVPLESSVVEDTVNRVVKFKDPTPDPVPSPEARESEVAPDPQPQEDEEDLDRYENNLVTLE